MNTRNARVLVVLLAVLAFALGAEVALSAGTFVVDTLIDENDGSCLDGDCSLRDAIEVAASGDSIEFSVTGTITLTNGELLIEKDLAIDGPGASNLAVSGDDASRVFNVGRGSVVSITGLTTRDGFGDGGGVRNEGTVYLSNCVMTDHWGGDGGAVLNNSGTMAISNCTIARSSAPFGGGIDNLSGGVLTVTDSIIVSNTAEQLGGGLLSFEGRVVISRTLFVSNTAGIDGGAIWNGDEMIVAASAFVTNSAEHGGGIYTELGEISVVNSTLWRNVAYERGGGIDATGGVLNLTNCTIVSNTNAGIGTLESEALTTAINTIVAGNTEGQCKGEFTSGTNNLATDGKCGTGTTEVTLPQLALGEPEGSVPYVPLLIGSLAIDAGTNEACPGADQRGVARPQDPYLTGTAVCDVGAYEALPFHRVRLPFVLRSP